MTTQQQRLVDQYHRVVRNQQLQEGLLETYERVGVELGDAAAGMKTWGNVAVVSNAIILPLNVIINAMNAPNPRSLYQRLAMKLYEKSGASGTRSEGQATALLEAIKGAVVDELGSRGLKDHVPGVRIIFGFAQDAMALYESAVMVEEGSSEMKQQIAALHRRLEETKLTLMKLGIERAWLHEMLEPLTRTA